MTGLSSGGFVGVGLSLSNEEPVAVTLALGERADELGYDEVSIPESRLHRSTTSVAAAILARTRRITVRVGVANPVTRHPLLLAAEAATLADLGGGRVRFGIGACEWTMRAFGCDPDGWLPYTNTVEAVRAMRSLLAGGPVGFEPTTFAADPNLRLDLPPPSAPELPPHSSPPSNSVPPSVSVSSPSAPALSPAPSSSPPPVPASSAATQSPPSPPSDSLSSQPPSSDSDPAPDSSSPAPQPVPIRVPVDVGAVNARMLTAAGRWADGVQLGALMSPAYVAWAAERVADGARAAGRDPGEVLISGNVLTSLDRNRAAARREVCEVLAYYLARVEGVVVDRSGADPEAVAAVRAAVRSEGLAAGTATVSDQLIDTFAVTGDTDEVIERLAPFGAAGMAMPLLWYTLGPDPDWAVAALATEVLPAVRQDPS